MNENEEKTFRLVYEFYGKWRGTIIETDEQWLQFGMEVGVLAAELNVEHNRLALHLIDGVIETINDLYKDGAKPMPAGYFGRDDI